MPYNAVGQPTGTRAVALAEWVTPTGVVLAASGPMDAMGCRVVEQQLRRMLARWPGIYLTLELDGVTATDEAAAEDLILSVVALRAGEARIGLVARGGACRGLLARMGVDASLPIRWMHGEALAGVTA
jgi:hypothetical protein